MQTPHQVLCRGDVDGAVGGVDHHAGPGTGRLFHIFHRCIIHGYLTAAPALGEVGRQLRRLENALLASLTPEQIELLESYQAAAWRCTEQEERFLFRSGFRLARELSLLPGGLLRL